MPLGERFQLEARDSYEVIHMSGMPVTYAEKRFHWQRLHLDS